MFDPTAFENIKVVIEGEIYDRDLSGEIVVTDRNDWINTAKLSRKYEITFSLYGNEGSGIFASMILEAGLENLSAELLGHENSGQLAGCNVFIHFNMVHRNEETIFREIQDGLEDTWGMERAIEQIAQIPPFGDNLQIENTAMIRFNRLVYEDQIDDLSEMVDYMIKTLKRLKETINL